MFGRKDIFDAAMKPPQLTSTRKTLRNQLFDEEKADLQQLHVSKAAPAQFSLLLLFPAYTNYSA